MKRSRGRRPRLAGDRLIDNEYQPIPIEEVAEGVLQGYSAALNLLIRWDQGELEWHDPATGRHITTFTDERAARLRAEAELRAERAARIAESAAAEARVRQLEAELRRLRDG